MKKLLSGLSLYLRVVNRGSKFFQNIGTILFVVAMFWMFFRAADNYLGWSNNKRIGSMVRSDGSGYYAYLPNWFIYRSGTFDFIETIQKKYPKERYHEGISKINSEGYFDKFFPGSAVLISPFFLVGHVHANIAGISADGYSWPYMFWVCVAVAFYGAIGLLGFVLTGLKLHFTRRSVFITAILIGLGTNYFFYASGEIPMAHVFSFSTNIWTIYFFLRWKDQAQTKWKILFALLFGLSIIIRPVNALTLIVLPFLFKNFRLFLLRLREAFTLELYSTVAAFATFGAVLSIQLFSTYSQIGKFRFSNYSAEGFDNWQDPYFWHSLFGLEKGMFVYSPVLLLIIPGMLLLLFKRPYQGLGMLLFFILTVYSVSSWWCWGYGGALGLRALIDFYGVYAFCILFLLDSLGKKVQLLMLLPIGAGIWLYQVYDFQFRHNILKFQQMDYRQLKLVFLKTASRYEFLLDRKIDTLSTGFHAVGSVNGMQNPVTHTRIDFIDFNWKSPQELPYNTIDLRPYKHLKGNFAYRFVTEIFLDKDSSYTTVYTKGYGGGKELFNFDNPYAHFVNTAQRWEKVRLDVTTDYPVSKLDSVVCVFAYGATASKIRNPHIIWGVEPLK